MNEATGFCEGCLRTIDEIAAWSSLDDAQKKAIWLVLPARRKSSNGMSAGHGPSGATP
jgi:predicted Fe-S protein YdhL (DUF1289 family)